MARYLGSVCRLCRREGMKLFLKGDRCYTDKCAIEKRNYPPGAHGAGYRQKQSEYGIQLREKQKVKRLYGVLEKQFRRLFAEASRKKGITGENLLRLLERRLDNVVYRMGFASSRNEARQIVCHGHILLNEGKADIPSMLVKVNDIVSVREKSRKNTQIKSAMDAALRKGTTGWVEVNMDKFTGKIVAEPNREEITLPIQEQLIVELYSR
ncbi:MAG: 30S ribosomal protein S4 [SAR324 cluster bacterium]|nr:30S ribosomal protein S4 [SAR324 cluster bacterium]MCZ6532546.1 30S ribosomal protein S4 [SAR324 cluster bacterium]MCZ6557162.1 30S ribosomal protein S4 [SAR324 cluster bacterium]MCZ6646348.1 30S ribosomal protein S4 [SAR324 cluster bacterium]MCZ6730176.1 30S ribosomal protein S4 [SAR324 cluster bacterium]